MGQGLDSSTHDHQYNLEAFLVSQGTLQNGRRKSAKGDSLLRSGSMAKHY
jgi:hypothetical protein